MDPLTKVNKHPLDPELMKQLLLCVDAMPEEQRSDMTGRSIGIMHYLQETLPALKPMARTLTLLSFEFRMEALARLREHPEYDGWARRAEKAGGADLINEALLEIAAVEPLVERHGRPAFDPTVFFRLVLERTDAEGRA